jgi:preprotein translocase subunit Sec63
MKKYEEITKARQLLELPERATMEEIQSHYRRLLRKWHPDRCKQPKQECTEMTIRIVEAYRTIIDYCSNYKFCFSREEVGNHLSEEDWWFERFGMDAVWGKEQTKDR